MGCDKPSLVRVFNARPEAGRLTIALCRCDLLNIGIPADANIAAARIVLEERVSQHSPDQDGGSGSRVGNVPRRGD